MVIRFQTFAIIQKQLANLLLSITFSLPGIGWTSIAIVATFIAAAARQLRVVTGTICGYIKEYSLNRKRFVAQKRIQIACETIVLQLQINF